MTSSRPLTAVIHRVTSQRFTISLEGASLGTVEGYTAAISTLCRHALDNTTPIIVTVQDGARTTYYSVDADGTARPSAPPAQATRTVVAQNHDDLNDEAMVEWVQQTFLDSAPPPKRKWWQRLLRR